MLKKKRTLYLRNPIDGELIPVQGKEIFIEGRRFFLFNEGIFKWICADYASGIGFCWNRFYQPTRRLAIQAIRILLLTCPDNLIATANNVIKLYGIANR